MPHYQIELHPTADDELGELSTDARDRLTTALVAVSKEREPTSHPTAKQLEGQPGLFRVRAGDARAVCELSKPRLLVYRVGTRDEVYDVIDEIDRRRVSV